MAESYSILAQVNPGVATLTDAYTVPTSTQTVISSVLVANRSAASTSFRLSAAAAGAADNNKQYLAYDVPILGNETKSFTLGVTLNTTDVFRVYATLATLSFNVFGAEITAATGTTSRIFQTILTLTDAQIKASPTTPVTIVTAPAAGSFVKAIAASLTIDSTAGAYTNINAGNCQAFGLAYGPLATSQQAAVSPLINDNSMTVALTSVTTALNTSLGKRHVDYNVPNSFAYDAGAVSGTPNWVYNPNDGATGLYDAVALQVSTDNGGSGNFTGGNAANSAKITLYYVIEVL